MRDGTFEKNRVAKKNASHNKSRDLCYVQLQMPKLASFANARLVKLSANWKKLRGRGRQFPFPIDVVILWVEDSAQHRLARDSAAATLSNTQQPFGFDNQFTRFRDNEELLSCLRSIFWCIPWARRVHIVVADYQFPTRYIRHDVLDYNGPQITVIPHSSLLPKSSLPTFNSQAIEANIHRIDGLAEHFLYANDDFMIGVPLPPSYFFCSDGTPRYNVESSFVPQHTKTAGMTKHALAWVNNSAKLDHIFGRAANRHYPCHITVPMLRSSFRGAWTHPALRAALTNTSLSTFRTSSNIYLIGLLVYWNVYQHGARLRQPARILFHDVEAGDDVKGLMHHILTTQPVLFCLNDGGYTPKEGELIRASLRAMFPLPAPWEPGQPGESVLRVVRTAPAAVASADDHESVITYCGA